MYLGMYLFNLGTTDHRKYINIMERFHRRILPDIIYYIIFMGQLKQEHNHKIYYNTDNIRLVYIYIYYIYNSYTVFIRKYAIPYGQISLLIGYYRLQKRWYYHLTLQQDESLLNTDSKRLASSYFISDSYTGIISF